MAGMITVAAGLNATGGSTQSANSVPALSGSPFRFIHRPSLKAAEGPPFTVIIEEDFSYGWTGRVENDVHQTAMFGKVKFKTPIFLAGQAVYGIPMSVGDAAANGAKLFWCAPILGRRGWAASCSSPGQKVTYSAFTNGLAVQSFLSSTAAGSEGLSVKPGPVTGLPALLHVEHRVGKWHKTSVDLTTIISANSQQDGNGFYTTIRRDADGSARFAVGGGIVRLSERPDGGFSANILKNFTAEGSALIAP
ncbi:hypothetical protein WG907_13430 [Sphingobium sp. AN558]|uniref:hypothetical protein n=1 Tax=Sphingobium sp. AN558 TaxID=3133442 RepID=UPI0030BD83B4